MLKRRTLTIMPMGRSKAALLAHLDTEHACVDGEALTLDRLRNFHRGLHFPQGEHQADYHRHVGPEWCLACRGRSDGGGPRSLFHSCQFGGSGSYDVAEGSTNRKLCVACVDTSVVRHSCGLAGLQRMLPIGGRR